MTAVAASIAVVCAVALTNTVALADVRGSALEGARVVIPSSGSGTAAAPRQVPADAAPSEVPVIPPVAEVVQVPDPVVVAPPRPAPVTPPAPAAPVAPPASKPAPVVPDEAAIVAGARASGSWEAAREWALGLGWPAGRIDAWIAKLERTHGSPAAGWRGDSDDRGEEAPGKSERRQAESRDDRHSLDDSRRHDADDDRDRAKKPGHETKKDQSRESPERRD
jgi:hypothetical protein